MQTRLGSIAASLVAIVLSGSLVAGIATPVFADDNHLPIIDIIPTSSFTLTGDGIAPGNGPQPPVAAPPTSGDAEVNGTATVPVTKAFSLSYDRISLGAFDSSLSPVYLQLGPGPKTLIYPGASRDVLQNYRADYHLGQFNIEGGFGSRYRRCCPADSIEWHKGFLGVSYATRHLTLLNGGFFVLDITANDTKHFSSPATLAALPPGLSLPNNKHILTTQQAITAVIPITPRAGVRAATTFLWGALDYPESGPFPYYYNVFIISLTKQFTDKFGISAVASHVIQREQGYPFPAPDAIRTSAINFTADFHFDLNRLTHQAPATPGRPTQPGTPGGPGGPAQVGPTQGGTVSPAPGSSSGPMMMPGASPAPMMPGASPAPMMPGASPAPMMPGATPAPMMNPSAPMPSPTPGR